MKRVEVQAEQKRTLEPWEVEFVDLLTTPPFPTLKDVAKKVGKSYSWARQIRHEAHIAEAVAVRIAELESENSEKKQAVLDRLHDRAVANPVEIAERFIAGGASHLAVKAAVDAFCSDSLAAAKLFLEAIGVVGKGANLNVTTVVSQNGTLQERIEALRNNRIAGAK